MAVWMLVDGGRVDYLADSKDSDEEANVNDEAVNISVALVFLENVVCDLCLCPCHENLYPDHARGLVLNDLDLLKAKNVIKELKQQK